MDNPSTPILWILVVSGLTTGTLLVVVALVFAWNQRRLATEAERWGQHVLAAQDHERHRIARELHDDMVPRVYAARLAIDRDAKLDASAQLGEIAQGLRAIAHELHPPALDFLELPRALEEMVRRQRSADGPDVTFSGDSRFAATELVAVTLFRVAQEGLSNALKHANASHIIISVESADGKVRLRVDDNGHGMPSGVVDGSSFGIRSMRERLEAVGGALRLEARKPTGTILVAEVSLT